MNSYIYFYGYQGTLPHGYQGTLCYGYKGPHIKSGMRTFSRPKRKRPKKCYVVFILTHNFLRLVFKGDLYSRDHWNMNIKRHSQLFWAALQYLCGTEIIHTRDHKIPHMSFTLGISLTIWECGNHLWE